MLPATAKSRRGGGARRGGGKEATRGKTFAKMGNLVAGGRSPASAGGREGGRRRGRGRRRGHGKGELERQRQQDLASFADRWVPLVRLILWAAFARAGWSAE